MTNWLSPPGEVHAWLLSLSEKERRAAFPGLAGFIRGADLWNNQGHVGLAVFGCAPTAKKAVTQLAKEDLRFQWNRIPVDLALDLLRKREVPWTGELAQLMADRMDVDPPVSGWELVEALVRESGCAIPLTAGFTAGWIGHIRSANDADAALRQGPYTAALLPMLFEHDGMGSHLEYTYLGNGFNPALMRLANDDPEARKLLLDGSRNRLLRGGRPGQLRAFVTLHEALKPSPKEVGAATSDYIGLINAPLSTVAGLAQRMLRAAHESGLLEVEVLIEVSEVALNRPEKTLVKAQASWLKAAAKREPARAKELLALLELKTAKPALELVPFIKAPVAPMPEPIETALELAEELAALLAGDWSVPTTERVMAALVSLCHKDPDGLRSAILPLAAQHANALSSEWLPLHQQLGHAINAVTGEASRQGIIAQAIDAVRYMFARETPLSRLGRTSAGIQRMLEHRLAEIAVQINRQPVPLLLSTPAFVNGHLDPETLLGRLEKAEREGWQPWSVDFAQALLRLPRECDHSLSERAARLTSHAGQAFSQRLRLGQPDPASVLVVQESKPAANNWTHPIPRRAVAELHPPAGVSNVERVLFSHSVTPGPVDMWIEPWALETAAATLPSHREAVAVWTLSSLASQADHDSGRGSAALLPLLAECGGPAGPALHLSVVYGLTAHGNADRVATVDAILVFGNELDWQFVGEQLGDAVAAGALKLTRAVLALRQAAEAGAVAAVWDICRAALPKLLGNTKPRPGTPDLLDLTTKCAQTLAIREVIPEVEALAARGGSSRLATEAKRLHGTLALR